MLLDLVIIGKVATHNKVYDRLAIGVKNEKIEGFYSPSSIPEAENIIDYKDLIIMPGVVDNHTHSLGFEKEGHWNSTKAAAAGGVTTINDHPLDLGGAPSSSKEIISKSQDTEKEALVDFSLVAAGLSEKISNIKEVSGVGITAYKVLMHSTSGASEYNMRALDDAELFQLFKEISEVSKRVFVHAENDKIINFLVNKWKKEDKTYFAAHNETRPEITETIAVISALELARALKCKLHIVHVSLPRSFKLIQRARKEGTDVTGETCPHFLLCNKERWKEIGANYKINPPLRAEKRRLGLWEEIKNNNIDLIASDHAPHSPNNDPNIFNNFSGSPGLETMLPLVFSEGVNKGRINLSKLVELLSYNPAKINGLYPRKGAIEIGSDADFVIFDPKKEWVIDGEDLISQCN